MNEEQIQEQAMKIAGQVIQKIISDMTERAEAKTVSEEIEEPSENPDAEHLSEIVEDENTVITPQLVGRVVSVEVAKALTELQSRFNTNNDVFQKVISGEYIIVPKMVSQDQRATIRFLEGLTNDIEQIYTAVLDAGIIDANYKELYKEDEEGIPTPPLKEVEEPVLLAFSMVDVNDDTIIEASFLDSQELPWADDDWVETNQYKPSVKPIMKQAKDIVEGEYIFLGEDRCKVIQIKPES